jgi:diaminohydroxyphosphoribosylaminopyrimidine deaminase/5-amino-6-(5-phosphoribosylamino)uracil reductase
VSDEAYIERAIALAERGRGLVCPNPMVGAVIFRDDDVVEPGGGNHPEA